MVSLVVISGHSTYSRTAAEVLTALTGDPFFPGGMSEFVCNQNQFLVFEDGPSQTITLQWATYRDASDQCSLSRIWGGIHPPADDIPGRKIGIEIAADALVYAETYFFKDDDQDGFYNYVDCNDADAAVNPAATEICDNVDNDCNGQADDGLVFTTYYLDTDGDGFGDSTLFLSSCDTLPPASYVTNNTDCDDANANASPATLEICDEIDNDCSGLVNDNLQFFEYYLDSDGDGFGFGLQSIDTCLSAPPAGYVNNFFDCDDANAAINPNAPEVCDDIDNDCNGQADDGLVFTTYYLDSDGDGFGDAAAFLSSCETTAPGSYVTNDGDCDDTDASVNPVATEVPLDNIDNDCDGTVDEVSATNDVAKRSWKLFPNPTNGRLNIQYEFEGKLNVQMFRTDGSRQLAALLDFTGGMASIGLDELPQGVYLLVATDSQGNRHFMERVVKM